MAIASERYVHFLIDVPGRLPQRCRVSFAALATLEGIGLLNAHRDQSMRVFMKHRRLIEAVARRKQFLSQDQAKWLLIAMEDLDLTP
jgi:hypothetical protein